MLLFLTLLLFPLLTLSHPPTKRPGHGHRPPYHPPHHPNMCNYNAPGSRYFYLSDVTYESHIVYSTPAHLAVSYANLDFNLTNNAAYDASCTGSSSGGPSPVYFTWPQLQSCEEADGASGNATWIYIGYEKNLQVNETWTCGGHQYLGYGNVTLNLECETESWNNPNWTMGELYHTEDVTCKPISLPLIPTVVRTD